MGNENCTILSGSIRQQLIFIYENKKRKMNRYTTIAFVIGGLFFLGCKKKDTPAPPELTVSPSEIILPSEGGTANLNISGNGQWSVNNSASSWLQLSQNSGSSGNATIKLTAPLNTSGATRSTVLSVNSSNGQVRKVAVSQTYRIYPSYNTSPKPADATGMSSTAAQLLTKIKLGLNLGNTFEAPGGETGWGSPVITESFIKFVKQSGFNAIRIPCGFDWYHIDNKATAHIDQNWLNRIKEVIGYCVNNDMYVLLNIHWDGGWLENHCTPDKKDSVNAKQRAYWEQIATALRDFDEHLMFASANEPNSDDATKMSVLLSYHQTFVNAVRSTGGRNTYRTLVIQGAAELLEVWEFPTDPTSNRMIYETHNYTPYQFCGLGEDASWGKMFYYWGAGHHSIIEPERNATWGEEEEQLKGFKLLKEKFIDKDIPVLMGEYGAFRRGPGSTNVPKDLDTHNAALDYWITYVTKQALARGIKPFWWDTGGLLNRSNNTVADQRSLDALIAGTK
jgi:aryl-phospho-beta-D-glucosidase BglC (GH1 family)